MATIQDYVRRLQHVEGIEYELVLEQYEDLTIGELKELNQAGWAFVDEVTEIEDEDDEQNIIGHHDILYFKQIKK